MNARVIIVAAGRGRRLGASTAEIPKCMVKVAGRPILHWQLDALHAAGVTEVVIVRGYRGDCIDAGGHRPQFVDNNEWASNNILASLMCAEGSMEGGFFFSYSDIVYSPEVARRLVSAATTSRADALLVVDRRWQDAYVGRTEHPLPEAELAAVTTGRHGAVVKRVGKQAVPAGDAAGEFIGLARFAPAGATALRQVWGHALREGGLDQPFGRAATLRNAYLSDALNTMADAGAPLEPVFIDGQWREIDTGQDLASAEIVVPTWT